MRHVTIKQALQSVADNPQMQTDELIQVKAHELIARSLFEISNNGDASVRGSMSRANKARKMILDRMIGKRRPGSHPATRVTRPINFVDLTTGAVEAPKQQETEVVEEATP